jgi:hypothetical protein
VQHFPGPCRSPGPLVYLADGEVTRGLILLTTHRNHFQQLSKTSNLLTNSPLTMSENATSKLYGNGRSFGPSMQTKLSLYTLDASIDDTNLKNPGRFNQRSGPFTVFLGRLHFNSDFNEKMR